MNAPALTTTSYAILGLLAIRPWTTYELAKQVDRAMKRFWPRAESRIYDEAPRLVRAGLARAKKDLVGRRPRTTYSITPLGRRALREWLDEEAAAPQLEFEGLLKVFFGEHGDRQALVAHLAAARSWAEDRQAEDAELVRAYLRDGSPFPERTALIVLTGRFLTDFARLVDEWAAWAQEEVASWPDAVADARPARDVMVRVAAYRRRT